MNSLTRKMRKTIRPLIHRVDIKETRYSSQDETETKSNRGSTAADSETDSENKCASYNTSVLFLILNDIWTNFMLMLIKKRIK